MYSRLQSLARCTLARVVDKEILKLHDHSSLAELSPVFSDSRLVVQYLKRIKMASFAAQKGFLGCSFVAPQQVQTRRSAVAARAGPYDEELIKTAVSLLWIFELNMNLSKLARKEAR